MCNSILERLINKVMEKKLINELEWYRTYGSYINTNYPNIDAEACAYADGDNE